MKLQKQQMQDLATGAAFLATGGGGDPYLSLLCAEQALEQFSSAELLSIDDIDGNARIAAIGSVGAPTTSLELLPSLDDPVIALEEYKRHTGTAVDAVVAFEIGGANSLIPIVAAAAAGIPVIDGDGMGRALPEVQMMTYSIAGFSPTPSVAVDYLGNSVAFEGITVFEYEDAIRQFSMARGGMVTTVEFGMSAAELKTCLVPDTVSLAIAIGEVLNAGRGNAFQTVERLQSVFAGSAYGSLNILFTGTVTDVSTSVIGGYDIGYATLHSETRDDHLHVDIKNEYLSAKLNNRLLASVPDLITIVDTESSMPINSERLKFGQRVSVIGIGCPPHYKTRKALAAVGPSCFGFDFDYLPLETLNAEAGS